MTVYVDALQAHGQAPKPGAERYFGNGKDSCHLASDAGVQELLVFGKRIGLRVEWLQFSSAIHFDLTPSKRQAAVAAGAVEVSPRRLLLVCGTNRQPPAYPSDPMSYELRHQALVKLLDFASIEGDDTPEGIYAAIEGLQTAIGCPMTAEAAIRLWVELRDDGVEPTWDTWCALGAVSGETARDASKRLARQDDHRVDGWAIQTFAAAGPPAELVQERLL